MKTKSTIFHRKLMMKTASLIVLSIIICACSTNNKSLPSGIETVSYTHLTLPTNSRV